MQTLSGERKPVERVKESFSTTDRDRSDRNKQQESNTRDKPGIRSSHLHLSKYKQLFYAPRSRFLAALPGVSELLLRLLLQSLLTLTSDVVRPKTFAVCEAAERMRQVQSPTPGSQRVVPQNFSAVHSRKQRNKNIATLTKLQRVYYQLSLGAMSRENWRIAEVANQGLAVVELQQRQSVEAKQVRKSRSSVCSLSRLQDSNVGTSTPGFGVFLLVGLCTASGFPVSV